MPRWLSLTIATIAAAVAVALVYVLWRRRKADPDGWKTQDHLTALGIVVALFASVMTPLVTKDHDPPESPEEVAYRTVVRSACAALKANKAGAVIPTDAHGDVDRQALVDLFNGQVDAARAVLDRLWAEPPPGKFVDTAAEGKRTGEALLEIERGEAEQMADELPEEVPYPDAVHHLQRLTASALPAQSDFEAAMANLGGQPCLA